MTEKWLQYLWNYKLFSHFDFKDTQGRDIEVLQFGTWNTDAGPDFLLGKIKTQGVQWIGNIELHLKSSDWIAHQHSHNKAYENIILHVVFQHDVEVDFLVQKNIPTLELKNFIAKETLEKYHLLAGKNEFVPCEKLFQHNKIPFGFSQEMVLQKLDEKSLEIEEQLIRFKNNYEAVLFHRLAYAFGLKINADIFLNLAESLDFTIVNKIRQNHHQLEALFLGKAGWLHHPQDEQSRIWAKEYDYIKTKFSISEVEISPKFLRLRPPNFPTLRLSQLAHLYHQQIHLFSKIIEAKNLKELYVLFQGVVASSYWDDRYNFGKKSETRYPKALTKDFIDRIILNAVLPLKYTYYKHFNEGIADEILELYAVLPPENNRVIEQWCNLGLKMENALDSQSFLYLYKNYCVPKKCLNCGIAYQMFKIK